MRKVLFNSRNLSYKKPFGAVSTASEITINFPVHETINCEWVKMVLKNDFNDSVEEIHLTFNGKNQEYNIFHAVFDIKNAGIYYYRFEICTPIGVLFVGKGLDSSAIIGDWLPEWQLTVYDEKFNTPDWLKGGIIYHIFPDRFARVDDNVKPKRGIFKSWYQKLSIGDHRGYMADDFFGGNIKGVISKLNYLEEMGITAIYFSPIFESSSNHRYDTGDYFKIDQLFGTEEEFKELIAKAEEKGIAIILDGVFNHTGADSIYFNKFGNYDSIGAYQSKDSKYYDWFTFTEWPDKYDCWWGVTVVPTVARNATAYHKMITDKGGVLDKWTNMGVKGWRLDVVDELSSEFVEMIRNRCKEISSEIVVIGEVWEDASTKISYDEKRKYFLGAQLDGVMNYPFKEAIIALVKDKNIYDFMNVVYTICENYPKCALDSSMTLLGTHDTVRIITELADIVRPETKFRRSIYKLKPSDYLEAKRRLFVAAALQYFLPGIPTVYYGDEIGMEGFEDPLNRATYLGSGGDKSVRDYYVKLGRFRKKHKSELIEAPVEIKNNEDILIIRRGKLEMLINVTDYLIPLKNSYMDEISGEEIKWLDPMKAIVYLKP